MSLLSNPLFWATLAIAGLLYAMTALSRTKEKRLF